MGAQALRLAEGEQGMRYFVPIYLTIGALVGAFFWFVLSQGIKESDRSPDVRAAMAGLERAMSGLPGGVLTLIMLVGACWPLVAALYVRDVIGKLGKR